MQGGAHASGRDPRQRLGSVAVGRLDVIGGPFQTEFGLRRIDELEVDLRFRAEEIRRHGHEVIAGEFIDAAARVVSPAAGTEVGAEAVSLQGDEGGEAVVVDREAAGGRAPDLGELPLEPDALFHPHAAVADLVGGGADVRAVRVEFLEVRCALRAREVDRRGPGRIQVLHPGEGEARRQERGGMRGRIDPEGALIRPGGGVDLRGFDAEAIAQPLIGGERVDEGTEGRGVPVAGVRQEGLEAFDAEVEAARLDAHHAFDGPKLREFEVKPTVPTLVGEATARHAGHGLGVRVIGEAHPITHRADDLGDRMGFSGEVPATLTQGDLHVLLGHPVGRIQTGIRNPDISVLQEARHPEARAVAGGCRIRDPADRGEEVCRGFIEAVEVKGVIAGRAFGQHAEGTQAVDRADASLHDAAGGQALVRDTAVHQIDDPAEDAGAVEQGRRAAEHLRLANRERIDAHRVVRTGARGVEAADAVLGHLEAVSVQAADDRPAGIRAEVTGDNAGDGRQQVSHGRLRKPVQFGLGEHDRRAGGIVEFPSHRDGGQGLRGRGGRRDLRRQGKHRGGEQEEPGCA